MNRNHLAIISALVLFTSCSSTTPEKYFGAAVLNCNIMAGFAGDGMLRQLEQPSVKLVEGSVNQTRNLKRKELINYKISAIEENIARLRELRATEETRLLLEKSLELNLYILGVYRNEYTRLALLYDEGADREDTYVLAWEIHEKHAARFASLYADLVKLGKVYADKHQLKVNWKA